MIVIFNFLDFHIKFNIPLSLAGATGIEPISPVLETAILTVVLRPYPPLFYHKFTKFAEKSIKYIAKLMAPLKPLEHQSLFKENPCHKDREEKLANLDYADIIEASPRGYSTTNR